MSRHSAVHRRLVIKWELFSKEDYRNKQGNRRRARWRWRRIDRGLGRRTYGRRTSVPNCTGNSGSLPSTATRLRLHKSHRPSCTSRRYFGSVLYLLPKWNQLHLRSNASYVSAVNYWSYPWAVHWLYEYHFNLVEVALRWMKLITSHKITYFRNRYSKYTSTLHH